MPRTGLLSTRVRAIEIEWLAVAMSRHGFADGDVERLCSFRPGYLKVLRATNFPSRPARAKVESAVSTPLWATTRVFHLRCKAEQMFGYNPATLTAAQLRVELEKRRITLPRDADIEQLEEALLSAIAPLNPARANQ